MPEHGPPPPPPPPPPPHPFSRNTTKGKKKNPIPEPRGKKTRGVLRVADQPNKRQCAEQRAASTRNGCGQHKKALLGLVSPSLTLGAGQRRSYCRPHRGFRPASTEHGPMAAALRNNRPTSHDHPQCQAPDTNRPMTVSQQGANQHPRSVGRGGARSAVKDTPYR